MVDEQEPCVITLVIHQPAESPFDEQMSTDCTVADLVDRVRRRLQAEEGTRIRLICAGAVLQESMSIDKAVRFRHDVSVYHVHCAAHAPQPEPQLQPRVHRHDIVDEDGALLPGHHMQGIPAFDESGEVLINTARSRQADFIWGFSLGCVFALRRTCREFAKRPFVYTCRLVLGVLTLFILMDRAMPRMTQTGIMLGVSCNMLSTGFPQPHQSSAHEAHAAQDDGAARRPLQGQIDPQVLRDESTTL